MPPTDLTVSEFILTLPPGRSARRQWVLILLQQGRIPGAWKQKSNGLWRIPLGATLPPKRKPGPQKVG